ncbi:50S ribosomal protein L3 [Candidatus Wolfebacteria bacterium]|nr:50S ribosomal protein L3 [Candidatus Wolfebacteria bacterium]
MKFALGVKQHMTQVFDQDGRARAATILTVPQMIVAQVKTKEHDGYAAVQVGTQPRRLKTKEGSGSRQADVSSGKESRVNKAQRVEKAFQALKEFSVDDTAALKAGDVVDISAFAPGDIVSVSAISKGKGFQGVVKRHGFKGGPRTHGQKHSEREPGSIGIGGVQRVFKGTRMAGRMGGNRVTIRNLTVLQIDPESGTMLVSGALPGRRGTLIEVRG